MNKLQHLKMSKQFLRKVKNYRKNLIRMNAGKPASANMVKTMAEIDYYLGTIKSFDQMMRYIGRSGIQQNIIELIPTNKTAWITELNHLVFEGNVLQGRFVKQREIAF